MRLHSIQGWLTSQTSWGVTEKRADVRTLRRLNQLYDRAAVIGEISIAVLLVGLVCASAWLLLRTSYEDIIFWDATEHICVLDSKTGEISYVTNE